MIVAVPGAMPVTMPDDDPTVAMLLLLVLHVPPPASVSVVVAPWQTVAVPVIAEGRGLTVTVTLPDKATAEQAFVVMLNKLKVEVVLSAPVLMLRMPLLPIVAVSVLPPLIL